MQAVTAGRLDEWVEIVLVEERAHEPRRRDDPCPRQRGIRIEIEHQRVRALDRGDPRPPDVQLDHVHLREARERLHRLRDEIGMTAVAVLDHCAAHARDRRLARVLLIEALTLRSFRAAHDRDRAIREVRQEPRGDLRVVLGDHQFRHVRVREHDAIGVRDRHVRDGRHRIPRTRSPHAGPGRVCPLAHARGGPHPLALHLGLRLVFAQALERGLPHEPIAGPFRERDFGDEAGLDPLYAAGETAAGRVRRAADRRGAGAQACSRDPRASHRRSRCRLAPRSGACRPSRGRRAAASRSRGVSQPATSSRRRRIPAAAGT